MKEHIIRAILYQDMSVKWKDAELNGDVNVHLNVHQKTRQFVEAELDDFLLSDGEAMFASFQKTIDGEFYHENPAKMDNVEGERCVFRLQIPALVHNTPGEWGVQFFVVTDYDPITGNYTESYPFDKAKFSEHSSFIDDGLTVPTGENLRALYASVVDAIETAKTEVTSVATTVANEQVPKLVEEKISPLTTTVSENTAEIAKIKEDFIPSSKKGQPNGVASLNEDGQVPSAQLPPLDYLPLTGGTVNGDIAAQNFISGTGEDETIYADGTISHGGNDFMFPDKSGTFALQEPIDAQLALINVALKQSGLLKKYKQPITQEYTERVTADGLNVLDGSTAVLKKVVGNTVVCKNLVDIPAITAETAQTNIIVNFTQNIFVSVGELATVSSSIWRFSFNFADGTDLYATDTELSSGGKIIKATADNPIVTIRYRGTYITAGQYSKIMIAYGDTATPYQPYFVGLKSAYFGGIESTNADGTKTSTLSFPKTETPLGVTIDFETKKITDYGYTVMLTGGESWSFIGYKNGECPSLYTLVLPTTETRNKNAVVTDGILDNDDYASNSWWIGVNSKNLYWINIINVLELNKNWSDKLNPTTEERNQAIADFKAYLAQRYADGNPVTIRYISSTLQSETDITANNEYTAYNGGTEKVLDDDGAEYGADNTLSQDYILVTEV